MKIEGGLFMSGAIFYFIISYIYWIMSEEVVGTTALALTGGLALIIGFYVLATGKRIGIRPEDRLDAEIEEADADYGFFSPHSWWPLPTGMSAVAVGLGLIIGWWFTLIAVTALVISVIGWVTEYEKPLPASSH